MSNNTTPPQATTSYDRVPYEGSSFPQTHPDRLATLATLFGLKPAPVDQCRVLELGCAMGANLVPMAFHLPTSQFVGVDSSARQVAAARASVADVGLTNLRIEHADILDITPDWGQFDYLICHGVYSWVPKQVQDRILAIAASNLAPHGVAFVSYNTYPGWHMREMIRHMMRYHARQFDEVPERINQARALIDFLASTVDTTSYYGALLQEELKLVRRVRDSYLFHEHLEEMNTPVYFHEFAARAARHGLRYLADAEFSTMLASGFSASTAETLQRIGPDIIRAEQYMDFVRNRFFRQTLLCHANVQLTRQLSASALTGLLVASPLIPDPEEPSRLFRTPDGRRIATEFTLTRAALGVLSESWPLALDPPTLRTLVCERLTCALDGELLEEHWRTVLDDLLHCYATGAVEAHTWQAAGTNRVTARPRVSRLTAQQARTATVVTNRRHEAVALDPVGKSLAPVLDGTRDHAMLVAEMVSRITSGELVVEEDGRPTTDETLLQATSRTVDHTLSMFARHALLVA